MKLWITVALIALAGWTLAGFATEHVTGVDVTPMAAAVFAAGGALIALSIASGGHGSGR